MSSAANVSLFSLANSSVPKTTSVSSPRFSRVSFTPASMHSEGRSWRLEATAGEEKKSVLEEKIGEAQKGASDINDAIKEKAFEINEGGKDKTDEINKQNKVNLQSIKDKTDEAVGVVSDKTKEASKASEEGWKDAQDKAEKVKEAVFGIDGEK